MPKNTCLALSFGLWPPADLVTGDDSVLGFLGRWFPAHDQGLGGVCFQGHVLRWIRGNVGHGRCRDLGGEGAFTVGVEGGDPEGVFRKLSEIRQVKLQLVYRQGVDVFVVRLPKKRKCIKIVVNFISCIPSYRVSLKYCLQPSFEIKLAFLYYSDITRHKCVHSSTWCVFCRLPKI